MSKTLGQALLLAGLGLLVLLAMMGYVKLTQHRPPAADTLRVTVAQDIVWPWQEAELFVDLDVEPATEKRESPGPLVFLLDISPSMSDRDITQARRAAVQFRRNLGSERSIRVAVIEFSNTAREVLGFTSDFDEQVRGISRVGTGGVGGGTSFLAPLELALARLQGQGLATVILVTDGAAGESPGELAAFRDRRWRPAGHQLFMIGIGEAGVDTTDLEHLAEDPSRQILLGKDASKLTELFDEAMRNLADLFGFRARLRLPLAAPLWRPAEASPERQGVEDLADKRQPLEPVPDRPHEYGLPYLFFGNSYHWRLPIEPEISGILPTLTGPPVVRYLDADGEDQRVRPATRSVPKVLVITWFLLFLLLLPALLYLLLALLEWLLRRPLPIPDLPPVAWRRAHRPPPALPLRFLPAAQRIRWAPTLVIGLGRSGRAVLTQLQQNLDDSFDLAATRPVLLALDVARDELVANRGERFPGCLKTLSAAQVFVLPPESCTLNEAVHRHYERDHPAASLDLTPYQTLGAEALSLRRGTKGEAPLARLALLQDLSQGPASPLLVRLGSALEDWRRLEPDQRSRQVLVVADVQGGVGAGWLTDLLILLRRLVAEDEAAGRSVELAALLTGEAAPGRGRELPLAAPTLFAELDRLASAGSRPFRHQLAADPGTAADLLDGWVARRPQDALFVMPKSGAVPHIYPAAADALTLLLDRRRRTELTYQLQSVAGEEVRRRAADGRERYTQLAVHNAVFPRSFFRNLLIQRLQNLLGQHQVLFPELEGEGTQAQLRPLPVPVAELLAGAVDAESEPYLAALRGVAQGQCGMLDELAVGSDTFRHTCQGLKLMLVENANEILRSRKTGLAGLASAYGELAESFALCATRLGGNESLAMLVAACRSLNVQALTWIERFFGSAAVVALGTDAVLTDRTGRMHEWSAAYEETIEDLKHWSSAPTRTLVAPLSRQDLDDPAASEHKQERLLKQLVADWLDAAPEDDLVAGLVRRCEWEFTVPGAEGEPAGIDLVLRGTRTHRFGPGALSLDEFSAALRSELGPVMDTSGDFHVLGQLQGTLGEDQAAIDRFVAGLKGDLRGERGTLLVTIPEVLPTHSEAVRRFRDRLDDTARNRTAGAAEDIRVVSVRDRNRISTLQALPLLTARLPEGTGLHQPLHHAERLVTRYGKRLAEYLDLEHVRLPQAAGIALEDESRLRHFAALHRNGQVVKRDLDDLWSVTDGERWFRVTSLPTQTLADAAAYYVTHDLEVPLAAAQGEPWPADSGDDFPALLEWLLEE